MSSHSEESEAIERAALASLHAAATPEIAASLGLSVAIVRGVAVSAAAALPASAIVVNRAIGLGKESSEADVAAVIARYRDAGLSRYVIHAPATTEAPALAQACRRLGLQRARGWQKFLRQKGTPLPDTTTVEIRSVDARSSAAVAAIVCAAFDLGEAAEPLLGRLHTQPGWHVFAAFVDREAAGTGALFVRDGVGWIDWDATAPCFRTRGIQRALLAHRLRLADALGLVRVHTCTGEAVPGDPQHFYANILRCGFAETTMRPNWTFAAGLA
jgi:GNAT superfamily N-acetyltransferase